MEAKPWWQSKVLWFNAISFVLAILAMTQFQEIIPKSWASYILFASAIGNLVLRMFFTNGPVTGSQTEANSLNRAK